MTGGPHRLPRGGAVDRTRALHFTFDGRPLAGHPGDTLASALLANGVRTIGRSMRHRRPRGVFAAGFEEPNANLWTRSGSAYEPSRRATEVELVDRLEAGATRGWPSAHRDLGAVIGSLRRALTAGFYYKTFTRPRWEFWEPLIRRFASSTELPCEPSTAAVDETILATDDLVIGSGPAGLAAASTAVAGGRRVVLLEARPCIGGSLIADGVGIDGTGAQAWCESRRRQIAAGGATVLTGTVAVGLYDNGECLALETRYDPAPGGPGIVHRLWRIAAARTIVATGAVERSYAFANNDLPGVMLATAARRYMREHGVSPGRNVAIITATDDAYLTVSALAEAGIQIAAVADVREAPGGAALAEAAGVEVLRGALVVAARGRSQVDGCVLRLADGQLRELACDAILVSAGHVPLVQLACQRGGKARFAEDGSLSERLFLPEDIKLAGTAAGKWSTAEALADGAAAIDGKKAASSWSSLLVEGEAGTGRGVLWRAEGVDATQAYVDLQNDVTLADVEIAVRENMVHPEHFKRYTTLAMGTDQGRTSGLLGVALLHMTTTRSQDGIVTTTHRPPFVGVPLGAIAGFAQGERYRGRRLMALDDTHRRAGAVMDEFGGWMRPDHYETDGAGREDGVLAEMSAVRQGVGLFDASPLGKIEVFGPDAVRFLDRLIVSDIAGLEPGRIRYGLMLTDEGVVFDDGVIARMGEEHFVLSPTSGHADAVLDWLEHWHQREFPGMRVACELVTESWATIALAGPSSREVLRRLEPDFPFESGEFRHMSLREAQVSGLSARVARVSFTGELQYEISVPADVAKRLWMECLEVGRDRGIRPVGMEAWLRLRLEKGFIHVGTDTDGRTTPHDLGFGAMADGKPSDFVGRRSLALPVHQRDDREQLVGLIGAGEPLSVGSVILQRSGDRPPAPTDGRVTSAAWSPALGKWIALALLRDGRARSGELVETWDLGARATAVVHQPPFYDPGGGRMRA